GVKQAHRIAAVTARHGGLFFFNRLIRNEIERVELRVEIVNALQHRLGNFHRRERALAIALEESGRGQRAKVVGHGSIISPTQVFCEQTCRASILGGGPMNELCCSRRNFLKLAALAAPALSACTTMGEASGGPILIRGGTVLSLD